VLLIEAEVELGPPRFLFTSRPYHDRESRPASFDFLTTGVLFFELKMKFIGYRSSWIIDSGMVPEPEGDHQNNDDDKEDEELQGLW